MTSVTWLTGFSEDAKPFTGWTETWLIPKKETRARLDFLVAGCTGKPTQAIGWTLSSSKSWMCLLQLRQERNEHTPQEGSLLFAISRGGLLTFLFFWNSVLASLSMYCFSLMVSSICPDAACHFRASLKMRR